MKAYLLSFLLLFFSFVALADPLDGEWMEVGTGATIEFVSFGATASFQSTSNYANGASVQWFFEFHLPSSGVITANQILPGHVRSQDSYYGCNFTEPAQALVDRQGELKIRYPVLTYYLADNGTCVVTQQNWITNLFQKF